MCLMLTQLTNSIKMVPNQTGTHARGETEAT